VPQQLEDAANELPNITSNEKVDRITRIGSQCYKHSRTDRSKKQRTWTNYGERNSEEGFSKLFQNQ
jgi:hypothetical protein